MRLQSFIQDGDFCKSPSGRLKSQLKVKINSMTYFVPYRAGFFRWLFALTSILLNQSQRAKPVCQTSVRYTTKDNTQIATNGKKTNIAYVIFS